MKRHWIEYSDERRESPMTYWVHQGPEGVHWRGAERVTPPLPGPVGGRGFPSFRVEFDGFTFVFASLAELDACVETLSRKNLPTSRRISEARGTGAGPNGHWLSRLPAKVTAWKYRERAAAYLREAGAAFEKELGAS
jgi:hypothetical protein